MLNPELSLKDFVFAMKTALIEESGSQISEETNLTKNRGGKIE
jgi:hypothetical protein